MVRVTCLSPTKCYSYSSSTFAHLELLIFNLRTAILLLGAINEQTYKANNKYIKEQYTKQDKSFKRMY